MSRSFTAAMLVFAVSSTPACRKSRGGPDAAPSSAPVADAGASDGVPGPAELEAYVSGAGAVRLGMTESEVTDALGSKPSRRDDAQSPGAVTDVAWDGLQGPRPGAALGRFSDDGRLLSIEFAPAAQVYPRLDYATADVVTQADYVRRSVDRTLRMADIEAVTGPGYRASWTIMSGYGSPTRVRSKWLWEVDPGDRVLYVDELDGQAGQPVIRKKR